MINIEYGCNEEGDAKAVWKPIQKKKNLSEKPLNVSGFLLIHYQKGLNT